MLRRDHHAVGAPDADGRSRILDGLRCVLDLENSPVDGVCCGGVVVLRRAKRGSATLARTRVRSVAYPCCTGCHDENCGAAPRKLGKLAERERESTKARNPREACDHEQRSSSKIALF
eukprot:scaffold5937_cov275-Pinguiococcus_pyrenoidosus.AAC.12